MRKRKKRRKSRKWAWILFAFILLLGIIIVPRLFQNQSGLQKKSAEEYFEVFDATVNEGEFRDGSSYENSSRLIIYGISYKIRAIGGDAHDVIIQSWAKAEPVDLVTILEGEYGYVEQSSPAPFGYLSEKAENGMFPFDVKIRSAEAEGTITIYL